MMVLGDEPVPTRTEAVSSRHRDGPPRRSALRESTVQQVVRDHEGRQGKGKGGKGGRRFQVPHVPVRIGPPPEAADPDSGDDGIVGPSPFSCPFGKCPSSLAPKTRKALIAHLSARHVAHGQTIPEAVLGSLNMRACLPCKTLVPMGSRCRHCRSEPMGEDANMDAPREQVPMLPPHPPALPQPGFPTTRPAQRRCHPSGKCSPHRSPQ